MKGLPPSLRMKKRYIAFEIISEGGVDGKCLISELWESMISLFGELESAGSGIRLEYFDGKRGVIRCSRESLDKVKVALTLISRVGDVDIIPKILGVSGTIKKCVKRYLEVLSDAPSSDGVRPGDNGV